MEQVAGFEPVSQAYEARMLPLHQPASFILHQTHGKASAHAARWPVCYLLARSAAWYVRLAATALSQRQPLCT